MAIQFITTVIGTVGFALVFRLLPKHLPFVALGGLISFGIFTLAEHLGAGLYFANFLAAAATALYAEICARMLRAPASVFLVPCMIPLVPGSMLYSAMSNFLAKNYAGGLAYSKDSALTGLGIASGIIAVSVLGSAGIKKFGIFGRKA